MNNVPEWFWDFEMFFEIGIVYNIDATWTLFLWVSGEVMLQQYYGNYIVYITVYYMQSDFSCISY